MKTLLVHRDPCISYASFPSSISFPFSPSSPFAEGKARAIRSRLLLLQVLAPKRNLKFALMRKRAPFVPLLLLCPFLRDLVRARSNEASIILVLLKQLFFEDAAR